MRFLRGLPPQIAPLDKQGLSGFNCVSPTDIAPLRHPFVRSPLETHPRAEERDKGVEGKLQVNPYENNGAGLLGSNVREHD